MKKQKYFFCYTKELHQELKAAGAPFICFAYSSEYKPFWLYEKSRLVDSILNK
ncbi:hypothetical protein HUN88_16940 [Bacillus amyloliquefaciens]|uniref:hypothetical protein n=1 Tax=Bacillus velezensis TaxID=492670 RepID=UPI00024588BC|nr:hypothetical protein [Bacillus velezensis]MEC0385521.1 hypothetical protein [Bacillus velezensis]NUI61441.1 hypothetical protein [Bacillus amyloliquefaciens]OCB99003.1 hypothetical protein SRCM101294_00092 [Bacillus amyloliquefaciens]CCF06379.1 hypothetical protein BACAU_2845 [Bacillus velezensis CAU B946]